VSPAGFLNLRSCRKCFPAETQTRTSGERNPSINSTWPKTNSELETFCQEPKGSNKCSSCRGATTTLASAKDYKWPMSRAFLPKSFAYYIYNSGNIKTKSTTLPFVKYPLKNIHIYIFYIEFRFENGVLYQLNDTNWPIEICLCSRSRHTKKGASFCFDFCSNWMQSEICGKSNALPLGKQAAVTLAINHLNRIWECVPCRYNFPACWQSKGLHTSVS